MDAVFSEDEDKSLTSLVLYYNSLSDCSRKKEIEKTLVKKTEMLIFTIPLSKGFISEEDITEFYIKQKQNALEIISCYVITRRTYLEYLTEVLRKKSRVFAMQKYRKHKEEMILEHAETWNDLYDGYYLSDFEASYSTEDFSFSGDYDRMSLTEMTKHIIKERIFDKREASPMERVLRMSFTRVKARKDFLCLLLYVPSDTVRHESLAISKALEVKEEAIIKFFELKESYIEQLFEERRKEIEKMAIRHYKSLIRLNYEYSLLSSSNEEKKRILKSEEVVLKAYTKRIGQLRHLNNGLSHGQIAKLLNYSRASICQAVKAAVKNLEEAKEAVRMMKIV